MSKRMFIVESKVDLERCYPVMKELRPHLSFGDYLSIYDESHARDGYEIVAIEEKGEIIAVMGYRFLFDYVRGKHVYIDDLVCAENARSKGLGAELLKLAEEIAAESDCKTLRLCTGVENQRGMKFYERNGWLQRAFAYTKKLM
jgi:ribosomal protein S18 acetylase RimI-like enzyme